MNAFSGREETCHKQGVRRVRIFPDSVMGAVEGLASSGLFG